LGTIFAQIFRDFAKIFRDFALIFDKSKPLVVRLHPHLLHRCRNMTHIIVKQSHLRQKVVKIKVAKRSRAPRYFFSVVDDQHNDLTTP